MEKVNEKVEETGKPLTEAEMQDVVKYVEDDAPFPDIAETTV